MITIRQVRAAMALLDWSPDALADAAGLSRSDLDALGAGSDDLSPRSEEVAAVRRAMEAAGIVFIGREGVRLQATGADEEGLRPEGLNSFNDG